MKEAHRKLIEAIAEHLDGWMAVTTETCSDWGPDEKYDTHLAGPAGAKVTFRRAHYNQPDRLRAYGHGVGDRYRGESHRLKSVSFSDSRDPATIAKDLTRRYLTAYLDWYLPALKSVTARKAKQAEGEVLYQRVRALFPEAETISHYTNHQRAGGHWLLRAHRRALQRSLSLRPSRRSGLPSRKHRPRNQPDRPKSRALPAVPSRLPQNLQPNHTRKTMKMIEDFDTLKKYAGEKTLLLFQLGDFWELFKEDAQTAAAALGVTLTKRQGIPMAGFPVHSAGEYFKDLLSQGFPIATLEREGGRGTQPVKWKLARIIKPAKCTHTPGPWRVESIHLGKWIRSESGSYIVACPDHVEHEGQPVGSVASQDKAQAEIDANARLIAAAPDLLASCRAALDFIKREFPEDHGRRDIAEAWNALETAIAKAEGRAE